MADATDLSAHFSILADPRVERPKKHRLIDPPTGGFIAVCTMICGGASLIWGCSAGQKGAAAQQRWSCPTASPAMTDAFRRVCQTPLRCGGHTRFYRGHRARHPDPEVRMAHARSASSADSITWAFQPVSQTYST